MLRRIVLVTGATSGIGEAVARKFASEHADLVITGRRKERLEELANELIKDYGSKVKCLDFDIRDQKATEEKLNSLSTDWRKIDILVNNAGLASGLDKLHEGVPEDWDRMIDTNIKGLLYVSGIVIPWMIENGSGHVFNIGSIAGKEVYPRGNVYCATKHAVDALTRSMRIELMEHGIRVTQVAPGAVETEFSLVRFKGDEKRAGKVYQGYDPLVAGDIADIVHFISDLPTRVNVNDILVMPTDQANANLFNKS